MQPNAGDDCFDSDKPKQHNWLAFSIVMRENPFPQGGVLLLSQLPSA